MLKCNIVLWAFVFMFSNCDHSTATKQPTTPNASSIENKPANEATPKNILFFGNSITAGYGLDNISDGFVAKIQNRLDSLKLNYHCINAGLSGETTAGGADRVDWVISQQPFDVFILELGGNDALRGIAPESSEKNLQTIIDKVRAKNSSVKIILAGMEAPRNMGKSYDLAFHNVYPTLSKKNKIDFIPFILDRVGSIASLNQNDGIHPNIEGNKIVVENVWRILKNNL